MDKSVEEEGKEKANRNKTLRENQGHSRDSKRCQGVESEEEEEENDYDIEDNNVGWRLRRQGWFAVFGRSVRKSGGPSVNVTEVNRNHAHYLPATS